MLPCQIPKRTRNDTGKQKGQSGDQIEHSEGRAAQFCGRGIRNQLCHQPLGKPHVQSPEHDT
ncbi:hypothetical protein ATY79_24285 [Rhizobium sp. R693]|nr:hypothetical protein ATY79_24285 [Rhizobium sp. R693]